MSIPLFLGIAEYFRTLTKIFSGFPRLLHLEFRVVHQLDAPRLDPEKIISESNSALLVK